MKVIYVGAVEGFEATRDTLQAVATVEHVEPAPETVTQALRDADALLDASMKTPITDAMIVDAPRLKIISCATTGSDHIARGELERRDIAVRTLREDREVLQGLTPAAELSWALLMAVARRLPAAVRHVQDGLWVREEFPGTMLKGRRLGLVGCGRIGGWMARYARAFGMDVVGYDPYVTSLPDAISAADLRVVFSTADFISLHVHLSPETRKLVSRELIALMKPTAVLINTSRGAIVDEDALLEALQAKRIGGAGLDVLEGEPDIAEHPLVAYARTHDNLLITPHCGGFSPDAVRIVCARAAEKIRAVLEPAR
jgi:D-3-phosphoglycerate dehydrogenase / 2-oxoglutarate reductase